MARKKYRVYAIDNINNCEALLMVDGVYVINGAYECKKHRDGTLGIPHNTRRAYFVMDAPIPGDDYNKVLNEARKIMKEQNVKPIHETE